jgi:hypothetical protein
MKVFDKIFGFSTESVGDNEAFVKLIQVAKEDSNIHKTLVSILSMDPFQRKSAIGSMVEDMQLKGAPKKFVAAIAYLRDNKVADRALAILLEESKNTNT